MKRPIYFVDCFNTIILRKKSPNEVIFDFAEKLGERFLIEPAFFYNLFKKNQAKLAVKNKLRTGEAEYTLEDVLKGVFKGASQTGISQKEFLEVATQSYIAAEQESHILNREFIEKLKEKAQKNNARVFVVSDFYCGKQILSQWLEALGVLNMFEDVFVSADFKKTKRTTRLYKHLINLLNAEKQSITMFGDSLKSDIKKAKQSGLNAERVLTKQLPDGKSLKLKKKYGLNFEKFQQIFNENPNESFSNFAFPLFLFCKRLYEVSEKQGLKNLFFLSREGQFLKLLFDEYVKNTKSIKNKNQIKTHYLQVSRNSILLSVLKPANEEDFSIMFSGINIVSLKKFMQTLSFSDDEVLRVQENSGLNINKKYLNFTHCKDFKALKQNKIFQEILDLKRTTNKQAFEKYLESFGVDFNAEGLNIVDVGWSGTMQDMLNKFFEGKVQIRGFYVGSKDKNIKPNSQKTGLLYAKKSKEFKGARFFNHNKLIYEQLLRADHNCVCGYKLNNQTPVVCYDDKVNSFAVFNQLIKPMQDLVLEKFKKLLNLDYSYYSNFEKIVINAYYKLITKPTKTDKNWLIACQDSHFDNFIYINSNAAFINKRLRLFAFGFKNFFFKIKYGLWANRVKLPKK